MIYMYKVEKQHLYTLNVNQYLTCDLCSTHADEKREMTLNDMLKNKN